MKHSSALAGFRLLSVAMLMACTGVKAQNSDPTIMTINGKAVPRSEFEYSYNKNNSEGVIDRKSIGEYVDLFINYKLKVEAALDAGLDTVKALQDEFRGYRDQQIRPAFITDADVERKAFDIYRQTQERIDSTGGLIRPAHILVLMRQRASAEEMARAKERIDSIYGALQNGADFADLATRLSDDKGSARYGGDLSWIERGRLLPEFENVAFSLKKGEMSKPFTSAAGWHIILMKDRRNFFPYDSVKADIMRFIDQRNIREQIVNAKLDSLSKAAGSGVTPEQIVDEKAKEMEAADPQLRYLIKEYHDGPLLFEIARREVWDKGASDTEGLRAYFKKNKKKYKWDKPRFKGMAYHVKNEADVKNVRDAVKNLPLADWADKLRRTFNSDSVLRIRVEEGIFREGDNALVDREIFGKDTTVTPLKDYPIDAVYGKKIKSPEEMEDVKSLVVADYQKELEDNWVASLRKKYSVVVDDNVLKTVNNH